MEKEEAKIRESTDIGWAKLERGRAEEAEENGDWVKEETEGREAKDHRSDRQRYSRAVEPWRHSEVVKIMFEDLCRMNTKRTHELLEDTFQFLCFSLKFKNNEVSFPILLLLSNVLNLIVYV